MKNNFEEPIFGKIEGFRSATFRKVNSFKDILKGFC